MMSGAKAGAAVATAPTAGSKRGVGTIAEAAAAARAAASELAPTQAIPAVTPSGHDHQQQAGDQQQADERADGDVMADASDAVDAGHAPEEADPGLSRRNRASAGLLKESVEGPDNAAVHLILAERAYAYGRSIVEADPDAKKPGETLAIES